MGPFNYSIQTANPFDSVIKGYQAGTDIRQMQQQQQAAQAEKQRQNDVIYGLVTNPNAGADEYANAVLAVPQLREQLKQAWDTKNTAQQKTHLADLTQWSAAITNGKPEFAVDAMKARAQALEDAAGAPTAESKALLTQADVIKEHPEYGNFIIKSLLVAHPDGKAVVDALATLGKEDRAAAEAPADLAIKNAGAVTAGAKAKYADQQEFADLEKKGWDVTKIKADISAQKESNRIAAMNAAANRETNDLKRQELKMKIQEAQTVLGDKVRGKVADVESAVGNIDNMINTIERIRKNPALPDVLGSIEGSAMYPNNLVAAATNTTPYGFASSSGDERSDAIALIDTLGSQAFLSQIPNIKGMGSLSNSEGAKLEAAFQNLSRKQSEKQFGETLDEAVRLLNKSRKNVSARYGVPIGAPDAPAGPRPVTSAPGAPASGTPSRNITVDY